MKYSSRAEHDSPIGMYEFCQEGRPGWVARPSNNDHIRDTCPAAILNGKFCAFADWIFGADGIASLSILAYGDFSCHGRFADDCFMLCRGPLLDAGGKPYRFYFSGSRRDPALEELLQKHSGFLEACPTDTLV